MSDKLSIIIPCFNEKETVLEVIKKVEQVKLGRVKKEIIIVDDGSVDGTRELLKKRVKEHKLLFHPRNMGKGWAIRTALKHTTGDIVIIQDADLEYDPNDYQKLIRPIVDDRYRVVYGSREKGGKKKAHSGLLYYLGGRFLTWLTNALYSSELTDAPTCYKVFERELLSSIPLTCRRFEFCPEVAAKILKKGIEIKEVPIAYYPRKVGEGKKIRLRDGIKAAWTLIKYRLVD